MVLKNTCVTAFIIVLLIPFHSSAANKPKVSQPSYISINASFDPESSILPAKYQGHNISDLYNKMKKMKAKSEFETLEAYENRIKSSHEDAVYGFKYDEHLASYDAEKQEMTVSLYISSYSNTAKIKDSKKYGKSYMGVNAFGVKKLIKEVSVDEYALKINNMSNPSYLGNVKGKVKNEHGNWEYRDADTDAKSKYDSESRKVYFFIDRETAKHVKGNLKILLICKPDGSTGEFTIDDTRYSSATIHNPYDVTTKSHTTNIKLLRLSVYDYSSGKVYFSQDFL